MLACYCLQGKQLASGVIGLLTCQSHYNVSGINRTPCARLLLRHPLAQRIPTEACECSVTLLLLMKPRFFPVPGHTPVSNWTSSVPVLNRALKNIQCWIISSLTWTPLLPRFPIAFFLPVCFCLDSFGFWI